MDKRIRCIALTDGQSHRLAEVPGGRITCQVCYYRWVKEGRPGARGPQKVASILCVNCNHAVCSVTCLNQLHSLK